jgi:hypothetical protein
MYTYCLRVIKRSEVVLNQSPPLKTKNTFQNFYIRAKIKILEREEKRGGEENFLSIN